MKISFHLKVATLAISSFTAPSNPNPSLVARGPSLGARIRQLFPSLYAERDCEDEDSGSAALDFHNLKTSGKNSTSSASTKATSSSSAKKTSTKSSSNSKSTATKSSSGSPGSSDGSIPALSRTSVLSAAQTIAAGASFDGGMVIFDRGVSCTDQAEGGDSDTVFQIEAGSSLSNFAIGPNQIEGVHCQGGRTLTNVWWSAVCEDAFTAKNQDAGDTTKIAGCGAFGADDKVVQHNGAGAISISDLLHCGRILEAPP